MCIRDRCVLCSLDLSRAIWFCVRNRPRRRLGPLCRSTVLPPASFRAGLATQTANWTGLFDGGGGGKFLFSRRVQPPFLFTRGNARAAPEYFERFLAVASLLFFVVAFCRIHPHNASPLSLGCSIATTTQTACPGTRTTRWRFPRPRSSTSTRSGRRRRCALPSRA